MFSCLGGSHTYHVRDESSHKLEAILQINEILPDRVPDVEDVGRQGPQGSSEF